MYEQTFSRLRSQSHAALSSGAVSLFLTGLGSDVMCTVVKKQQGLATQGVLSLFTGETAVEAGGESVTP